MAAAKPVLQPGELARLAAEYLRASEEIKQWEAFKKSVSLRLTELHNAGLIKTKFLELGHNFALQNGRTTVKFDSTAKGCIDNLKQELFEQGHGAEEIGSPFWVAKPAAAGTPAGKTSANG